MAKQNLGEISKKVYDLLSGLNDDERIRIVQAALALFGDAEGLVATNGSVQNKGFEDGSTATRSNTTSANAKEFFRKKDPRDRGEQLAVAARFLEEHEGLETLTKEDFERAFKDAKRSFDKRNFSRDMSNAKGNAKLFISGGKPRTYKLSFYGEEYVDALPDREAASKLKPSSTRKKGRSKKKKKASKASAK